jgi:hypothetical protein
MTYFTIQVQNSPPYGVLCPTNPSSASPFKPSSPLRTWLGCLNIDTIDTINFFYVTGSGSPTLWCTVSHKPLFGDSLQTIIPSKNLDHLSLRHLQCGKHYDVSVVCFNGQGPSRVSDVLRDVRTLGQKPVVPRRPTDFVHPSNVSVRLDLFMWNDENCPVDYFVVSYKRTQVRCLFVYLSEYISVSLSINIFISMSVYLSVL